MNSGSYFADADGSLWWGNDLNVVHYTPPPDLVHPQFVPQVFISASSWDGAPPRLAEAVGALRKPATIVRRVVHIGRYDDRAV
ncbi:MAG: hypothetical protein ACLP59_14470 [Bryobacteraceae bacterium]